MKQARLGRLDVARIGFGAMGMSAYYTGAREDDEQSIRTIRRAIDLGVTLIDTAEVYGPLPQRGARRGALTGRRDEVVLATKFGQLSHRGETDTQHIDLADLEKVRHLDSIISTASTRPPRSSRPGHPDRGDRLSPRVSSLTRAPWKATCQSAITRPRLLGSALSWMVELPIAMKETLAQPANSSAA